jgi:SNF2 family DNA or RNA helicase
VRVATVTAVFNEKILLPQFVAHYAQNVDRIFLVDNESDDGSVEAAILQIDAAGSALNLQAANRIIMLEPSWTPGTNGQAVARAVRIGQSNPVLISWPVVRHSIDESVMRVLRHKQAGLAELWRAAS